MSHDLFVDENVTQPGGGTLRKRRFDLHLADLNLGFSLSNRSALIRALRVFGRGGADSTAAPAMKTLPSSA